MPDGNLHPSVTNEDGAARERRRHRHLLGTAILVDVGLDARARVRVNRKLDAGRGQILVRDPNLNMTFAKRVVVGSGLPHVQSDLPTP